LLSPIRNLDHMCTALRVCLCWVWNNDNIGQIVKLSLPVILRRLILGTRWYANMIAVVNEATLEVLFIALMVTKAQLSRLC